MGNPSTTILDHIIIRPTLNIFWKHYIYIAKMTRKLVAKKWATKFDFATDCYHHYNDVTWASWRTKSPAALCLINSLLRLITKTNKISYYRRPMDFPHKGSVMWEVCLRHGGIIYMYTTLVASMLWTCINSLRPSDTIGRHSPGSTLAQVVACCLAAPSHYLNRCWSPLAD